MSEKVLDPSFWSKKRVFLTGHTGFKGSWLSLWLSSMGASVYGYALAPPSNPNLYKVAQVDSLVTSTLGDIRDRGALRNALRSSKAEIVIHMAAQPLVRDSYDTPMETYEVNVMGTAYLLEECRSLEGLKAILVVTTDKCYLNREWQWGYRENEPMGGHDPYSSSKACAELVTSAMRDSFFRDARSGQSLAQVATARAGNVIGGGDWAKDRLIPDVVRAIAEGRVTKIRHPLAIRPWQFVLEPLAGYLMVCERLFTSPAAFDDAWNFGPAVVDERPVKDVLDLFQASWGPECRWEVIPDLHARHEAGVLRLDWTKAHTQLGWSPRLSLERSLYATTEWYKRYSAQGDRGMREFSLEQIERYISGTL